MENSAKFSEDERIVCYKLMIIERCLHAPRFKASSSNSRKNIVFISIINNIYC